MKRNQKINLQEKIEEERQYLEKYLGYPIKIHGSYSTGEFIYPYSDIDLKIYINRPTNILGKIYTYLKSDPYVLCIHRNNEIFYLFIFDYKKYNIHFQLTVHGMNDEKYDVEKEKKRKYYLLIHEKNKSEFLQMKKQLYKLLHNAEKRKDENEIQYFQNKLYLLKKKYFIISDLIQEFDIKYNLGKLDMKSYQNDNLFLLKNLN